MSGEGGTDGIHTLRKTVEGGGGVCPRSPDGYVTSYYSLGLHGMDSNLITTQIPVSPFGSLETPS